jgi:hypothetical protein
VYRSYDAQVHEQSQNPFAPKDQDWSPYLPIIVGMDFNISPMSWVLGQNKVGDWYWGDEISLENSHTPEAAAVLVEKVKGHKPGVTIVGDASGNARQRAAAGQSDYDIIFRCLDGAGIKWTNRTPESNPAIKDRVNTVNGRLLAADGSVHMWHNPKCKQLKKDFQRVVWKEGEQIVFEKKDRMLTHMSDAVGYPICELTPIPSVRSVGGLVVLRR